MPVQVRTKLSTEWTSENPILADGEPGFEKDTLRLKVGDGSTSWNTLPYGWLVREISSLVGTAPGTDTWFALCATSFALAFTAIATVDSETSLPIAATIQWPDGTAGDFTATIDAGNNGYSAWTATYLGKTISVSGITYDSDGNVFGPTDVEVT